jgi:hypothetical protein
VTVVEHAGFWGAGEPIFVSSLGAMPPLIRNLRFVNISAVSENGALFSSLPLNATTRGVEGIELTNVNITIKHTGNVTGAPKGKDYSPTRDGFPAIVPAWVSGMSFEGVPSASVHGGWVSFEARGGAMKKEDEKFWSFNCVNESAAESSGGDDSVESRRRRRRGGPTFDGGWACKNSSSSALQ